MTIHLPEYLESSLLQAVHNGRFASLDDAMAEAARLLLREIRQEPQHAIAGETPDPLLGVWRDAPDELDEIVADAMKKRQEEPWRDISVE
jgi:Arc/MetJ-type ribon-helix-helix transcriptional regulator